MADVTRLVNELDEYKRNLERHVAQVGAAFEELQRAYGQLSPRFEGRAAREFKSHWGRTVSGLKTYTEGARGIQKLLDDRLKALRDVDRTDGL